MIVPFKDVMTGKLDLFAIQAVEELQQDDSGHFECPLGGMNNILSSITRAVIGPFLKGKGLELASVHILVLQANDDLGMPDVQKSERPPNCADVDSLPAAVQNQNTLVDLVLFHAIFVIIPRDNSN
jgi:hypothetical protein